MRKILFLLLVFLGCRQEKDVEEIPRGSEFTRGFSVYESYSGEKKWFLEADSAIIRKDIIWIYSVHLKFLNPEGDVNSILTSDSGVVLEKTGDLVAYGHVCVVSGDSINLFTDSLRWDNKQSKIFVDGSFRYRGKKEDFTGVGLESDPGLKRIIVKKRIEGKGEFEE